MSDKTTDVMVHINNELSDRQYDEISDQINRNDGIVSVCRTRDLPKSLTVVYNAGRTEANSILNSVTKLGYKASLVGM